MSMPAPLPFSNGSDLFRKLRRIFAFLLAGQLLFMLLVLLLRRNQGMTELSASGNVFQNLILILIIASIVFGYVVYFRASRRIIHQMPLRNKLIVFFNSSLAKLALLEFAGILSLIGYLLTGVSLYIVLFFMTVGLMFLNRPTISKLHVEFKLSHAERRSIESDEELR